MAKKLEPLFKEAINYYTEVSKNLKKIADTFPFEGRKPKHTKNKTRISTGVECLKAARSAETKGLASLGRITEEL
jgi:hypothetical protein